MRLLIFLVMFVGYSGAMVAQMQDLVRRHDEPVDFIGNPWNILLYIVAPIILVIFYWKWSKMQREERQKKKDLAKQQDENESNT